MATTHKTQALLALMQLAITRTDITLNPAIVKAMPVSGRKEVGSDSRVQGSCGGYAHYGLVVKGSDLLLNPAGNAADRTVLLVDFTRNGRI